MPTVHLSPIGNGYQFLSSAGVPLAGGLLSTYAAGTSTPKLTYTTSAGNVANPLTITLDASGRLPDEVWLIAGSSYKFVLTDALSNPIDTYDNISGILDSSTLAASGGSALVGFLQAGTSGPVARTTQAKHRDIVSIRDYGVVPDDNTARTANTTAARKLLCTVANGGNANFQFRGSVWFPLGATYYFDGVLACRDGISLELEGSTLDFAKAESTAEDAAGFLYARRDFAVRNGYVNIDYTATVQNRGNAIKLNARYADADQGAGQYFLNNFEEDQSPGGTVMPYMPGNIELRNLRITSNNPKAAMIQMVGGLKGVTMENVFLDGQNLAYSGIDYEFGGATDEPLNENEKSSHGRNFHFRNIEAKNLNSAGSGVAVGIRGAYNVTVENLFVRDAKGVLAFSPGEAENYNPGADDVAGVKFDNYFRNIIGQNITGTAFSFGGNEQWTGYLSPLATQAQANVEGYTTGLTKITFENFKATSSGAGGNGISSSAGRLILRHGRLVGFINGIFDEGTRDLISDDVDILDSTGDGVRFTVGSIYPSGWRDRNVRFVGGRVSGNGGAGAGHGILFENGQVNAIIEGVTFGSNNRATARLTVTGGTANPGVNKLSSLKVNGVEILNGAVDWATSNTATATAIAASINAKTSAPDYTATSYGAEVLVIAASGTGATPNGFVLLPTVAGDVTVGSLKDMSGGSMELNQVNSVYVSSGLQNVTVRNCNTLAVSAGGVAYLNQAAAANNNMLDNNIGDVTTSGGWNYNAIEVRGSWTPIFYDTNTGTVLGLTGAAGTYRKTGSLVFITGLATRNDATALVGQLLLGNLPYPLNNVSGNAIVNGTFYYDNGAGSLNNSIQGTLATSILNFRTSGGGADFTTNQWVDGRPVRFNLIYETP